MAKGGNSSQSTASHSGGALAAANVRAEQAEKEAVAANAAQDEAIARAENAEVALAKRGAEPPPKEARGEVNIFASDYTGPITCDQAERIHKHRAATAELDSDNTE